MIKNKKNEVCNFSKLINPRPICVKDYRLYERELGSTLKIDGKNISYVIEKTKNGLKVNECHFVGMNTVGMGMQIHVFNLVQKELSKIVGFDWIPLNELMPLFRDIYDEYRGKFLGEYKKLKKETYQRYFYILFLLWKKTNGSLGFIAEHTKNKKHTIIDIEKKKILNAISLFDPHGYKVKAIGDIVITLEDIQQTKLIL